VLSIVVNKKKDKNKLDVSIIVKSEKEILENKYVEMRMKIEIMKSSSRKLILYVCGFFILNGE
jgi:hypothetical protein